MPRLFHITISNYSRIYQVECPFHSENLKKKFKLTAYILTATCKPSTELDPPLHVQKTKMN